MSARARLVQDLTALLYQCLRLAPPHPAVSADEPLFGGRLALDSVDSLQWATAVERQYRLELTERDFGAGVLETLGQMADALLERGIVAAPSEDPAADVHRQS